MTQLQFDLKRGERLKKRGQDVAAAHNPRFAAACLTAQMLAHQYGQISIDEVAELHAGLGASSGAIFRAPDWECVGYKKSCRVSNHARRVGIYRLVKR